MNVTFVHLSRRSGHEAVDNTRRSTARRWAKIAIGAFAFGVVIGGAGLLAGGPASASPVVAIDDAGPDDLSGQKDLTSLAVDYAAGSLTWAWDDTSTTGANTMDGCALFDTNGNGFANTAVCVVTGGSPLSYIQRVTYVCAADSAADRCAGPAAVPIVVPLSGPVTTAPDPFVAVAGHLRTTRATRTPRVSRSTPPRR